MAEKRKLPTASKMQPISKHVFSSTHNPHKKTSLFLDEHNDEGADEGSDDAKDL